MSNVVDTASRTAASLLQARSPLGGTNSQSSTSSQGSTRGQPSAAGDIDPAVVNHVRPAGSSDKSTAADGSTSRDKTDASKDADKKRDEEVRQMQQRDGEVRAHERAHAGAAGALGGAPSFSFEQGPDGRSYAVAGEVQIDVSPVSDDPQATIRKMQQVKRAALAPQDPSDADRAIAARADAEILAASRALATPDSDKQQKVGAPTAAADKADASKAGDAATAAFNTHERRSASAALYRTAPAEARGNVIHVVS